MCRLKTENIHEIICKNQKPVLDRRGGGGSGAHLDRPVAVLPRNQHPALPARPHFPAGQNPSRQRPHGFRGRAGKPAHRPDYGQNPSHPDFAAGFAENCRKSLPRTIHPVPRRLQTRPHSGAGRGRTQQLYAAKLCPEHRQNRGRN